MLSIFLINLNFASVFASYIVIILRHSCWLIFALKRFMLRFDPKSFFEFLASDDVNLQNIHQSSISQSISTSWCPKLFYRYWKRSVKHIIEKEKKIERETSLLFVIIKSTRKGLKKKSGAPSKGFRGSFKYSIMWPKFRDFPNSRPLIWISYLHTRWSSFWSINLPHISLLTE